MRIYIGLLAFSLIALSIVACQKEIPPIEPTNPRTDTAVSGNYSLAKSAIVSVVVNGTYKKDSALQSSNNLYVRIKVASPGTYRIFSDTVQNFYFNTSASFIDTGYKELTVAGFGKPLSEGNFTFVLRFDTCRYNFGLSVQTAPSSSSIVPGTIAYQQEIYGFIGGSQEAMIYDPTGTFIKEIQSRHYPSRKVFYNANNKISKIEYWYASGSGLPLHRDEVHSFEYDASGNVIKINDLDTVSNQPRYPVKEYVYNSDNTIKVKKTYTDGLPGQEYNYVYTNGNLTGVVTSGDTMFISYDTRINNFKSIYPQFYFLDIETVFLPADRSEAYYFSKNYPTKAGLVDIIITTTPNGSKPLELTYNSKLYYRYGYN